MANYRTAVDDVYAAGDVIGSPASRRPPPSKDGWRRPTRAGSRCIRWRPAVRRLFDPGDRVRRQDGARADRVPRSRTKSASATTASSRGQILGDEHGLVKLLVSPEDRKLLGVHALGANATEVVHIGQAVMGLGGTVDFLVESVFNYPTLAEALRSPHSTLRTNCARFASWPAERCAQGARSPSSAAMRAARSATSSSEACCRRRATPCSSRCRRSRARATRCASSCCASRAAASRATPTSSCLRRGRPDAGFIIMEPTEYPAMSGSNTICTTTVLLETGIVPMHEPETVVRLERSPGWSRRAPRVATAAARVSS